MSKQIPRKITAQTQNGVSFFIAGRRGRRQRCGLDRPERRPPRTRARGKEAALLGGSGNAMGGDADVPGASLFSKAVDVIKGVSEDVSSGLLQSDPRPSEVELSLNLGFDAGGSVWILKGNTKASLQLKLKWSLPRKK